MITKNGTHLEVEINQLFKGDGTVVFKHLLDKEEFKDTGRLFSITTIPAKCSIGYHVHENESEVYHVISGEGIYSDNGNEVRVTVGDTTYCSSGQGHGIKNETDQDLVVVALIIFNDKK